MATSTSTRKEYTDEFGIERAKKQEHNSKVEQIEEKAPAVGHVMRMQERFGAAGGNQFACLLYTSPSPRDRG